MGGAARSWLGSPEQLHVPWPHAGGRSFLAPRKRLVRLERLPGTPLLFHTDQHPTPTPSAGFRLFWAVCNPLPLCACVFAKFVTNFLFGFGLRLEALCVLKPGRSQKSSASLSAAVGRPFVFLPFAGFCRPVQTWQGGAPSVRACSCPCGLRAVRAES